MEDGDRRALGQFVWNTTTGQWRWSAGMYELHGYRPGCVPLSSELVLQHKHRDHRAHASLILDRVRADTTHFSNYHVIVDTEGRFRTVLAVGESRDKPVGISASHRFSSGFLVDVTLDERAATTSAVAAVRESAAPIQQSLGLLMGSLGFDEDTALAMLRRVSSQHNVKVAHLARGFVRACVETAAQQPRDLAQLLVEQGARLAQGQARAGVEEPDPSSPDLG